MSSEMFSNTVGASITVGYSFTAGVPAVSSETISASLTASYSHTWGTMTGMTETFTATVPVLVPAHSTYMGITSIKMATYSIPFTATVHITGYT